MKGGSVMLWGCSFPLGPPPSCGRLRHFGERNNTAILNVDETCPAFGGSLRPLTLWRDGQTSVLAR